MFVDGYNVIRSSHLYDGISSDDFTGVESGLNSAREALISDVAAMTLGFYDVTIVFDGANNPHSQGVPSRVGGIRVVFSRKGQTADAVIEKLVHESRESADEVVVVTSDALIQWTVIGDNVTRMSSTDFASEIRQMRAVERDDHDLLVGRKKNTLAERLDPETLRRLEELRSAGDRREQS